MTSAFHRPRSLDEAVALLAAAGEDGRVVAGGTALVLMMQQGLVAPDQLVSLDRVDDAAYRGIEPAGSQIRIGGGETITSVAVHPLVRDRLPSLATACRVVGNVRIRNRATLAGNLAEADYASDPPAVLVALGASCRAVSPRGSRWVPVRDLVTGFYTTVLEADEVLAEVRVPVPPPGTGTAYLKYVSRSSEDRPCVGVAATVRARDGVVDEVAVVVGAVADTPQTFPDVLDAARGRPAGPDTFTDVAAAYAARVRPLDDVRGSAAYRRRMVEVFVRRALEQATRKQVGT